MAVSRPSSIAEWSRSLIWDVAARICRYISAVRSSVKIAGTRSGSEIADLLARMAGDVAEVRHSKAAQEFCLLRHELLLGENIFLAQFREAFDCLHNVFHGERSRGNRSGCWRGGMRERS